MNRTWPPTFQQKLYSFLDPSDGGGPAEQLFNALLGALILMNVGVMVLGTVPEVAQTYGPLIRTFDLLCALIFGLEYLARLYVTPLRPGLPPGWRGHLRYALQPMPLIDLIVIAALLVPGNAALVSLRGLRLLKLLSLLRLGRYSDSLLLIGRVILQRAGELLTTVLIATVLVFIAASVLYQVESAAGTEGYGSIPEALWWAVVTLTTTGYGDVYPATGLGKLAAGVIMLFGVGMVALPAGMVASSFADELSRLREEEARREQSQATPYCFCPHCGEKLP
ncbi:Ion transport protein [Deinococcus proteolyticus MRP]|uniref:Ion transport protein n=1 Tax=Deinococcus proteolyticus (strain ATCC 35074 / DSM 20540 / JCM 6276 / NBRC 101906 / NCIMB 13154 / VKM Ac-1939 / CCM 2703 / MRP) TaxID=693977 RepID=F0RNV4_DEIPM|nr:MULTISPECIES: ion transporter [Deinococcus]ADY26363.1 Ion transport protein [Deinococcus proteolyticus MRP]MCY1702482.1 ion transporter [Deinococcus sp. SL84]